MTLRGTRITFEPIAGVVPGFENEWAELKERRTWDDAVTIQEAGDRSLKGVPGAFTLYRDLQIARCIERWSLDGEPRDAKFLHSLNEHVVRHLLLCIDEFYGAQLDEVDARRKTIGTD